MESFEQWHVANLAQPELQKIQQLESQMKGADGKNVVLIAYQHK